MTQKRTAFVIGNANYKGPNTTKLQNPVKDASSIATKLKKYGFELTRVVDGTFAEMRVGLATFQGAIEPGGVALVFFSGHGTQIDGENFLFAWKISGRKACARGGVGGTVDWFGWLVPCV